MTVTEKIHPMESIWLSFPHNFMEIASPAWHGDVLPNRKEGRQTPRLT